MSGRWQRRGAWLRQPALLALFYWCLPALLLGAVLRAVLWARMPHAFYHPDSDQVFLTYRSLLHGALRFHSKKTLLGPLLYCLPPLLHLPVLPTIALVQHLLGLGLVLMVGALVASSFARWRLLILPVTILTALNPILLWYEHVALPETGYVCSIVAVALAGLLYFRRPGTARAVAFGAALFCTAGFRPEGKLFFLFGLALVVVANWRARRPMLRPLAGLLALSALCFTLNRTEQSGALLFSNIAHLTPEHLRAAPGFAEAHEEHFAALRQRWSSTPTRGVVRERKQLFSFVQAYLQGKKAPATSRDVNRLCGKIGAEVCLRHALELPALALAKYRFALRNPTAEDFGPNWCEDKQTHALARDASDDEQKDPEGTRELVQIAYGRPLQTPEEIAGMLRGLYHPFQPDWLTAWLDRYGETILAWRLPDEAIPGGRLLGVPWLYLAAVAGLLALAARDPSLRGYHLLWLAMLLFIAFVLALTGSNLGRFRIGFEPFWFLYAFASLDVLIDVLARIAGGNAFRPRGSNGGPRSFGVSPQ